MSLLLSFFPHCQNNVERLINIYIQNWSILFVVTWHNLCIMCTHSVVRLHFNAISRKKKHWMIQYMCSWPWPYECVCVCGSDKSTIATLFACLDDDRVRWFECIDTLTSIWMRFSYLSENPGEWEIEQWASCWLPRLVISSHLSHLLRGDYIFLLSQLPNMTNIFGKCAAMCVWMFKW